MKKLLSSPSLVAICLDPRDGTAHLLVRTAAGEVKKKVQLSPQHHMVFNMAKSYVETYL